ncbi:MAG TPA: DNA topoisomerase VI subunit B [Candidatus Brocadiia bacterium]|nr:DNA topoisomerase VI subunit B [Candidatus Brocadiia bacterium]
MGDSENITNQSNLFSTAPQTPPEGDKPAPKSVRKPSHPVTAAEMAKRQREISISEFFTKNRHLLGFDNPRKALLTAVKEAVDNALDACEEAQILPRLKVAISKTEVEDRFKVVVEDNGPGIVRNQIPRVFGKLLYGSKFHRLKMSRGQQGIGISAAGMYGHLTTGKPVCVTSRTGRNKPVSYYEITINTQQNEPQIHKEEVVQWDVEHGTRVEIEMEGRYIRGRQSVDEYLEQTAIANPHTRIEYANPDGAQVVFEAATDQLPSEPREIKPHPYGIELGMLIKMLEETKARNIKSFLTSEFSRVSPKIADEILKTARINPTARTSRIARQEADTLIKVIRETKLRNPPMDCISPIGQEQIIAGLKKQIKADFYTAVSRSPAVYRGNPFLVEAGLAYGGELDTEGTVRLLRLANRVPLLHQQGGCIITQGVSDVSWKAYGMSQHAGSLPVGPLVLMVHVASVWVPFTSESKEAIAAYPEIEKEIRLAVQECGRMLGSHVRRRRREAEENKKRSYIEKYIPHIGIALKEILDLDDSATENVCSTLTCILERSRG